MSKKKKNKKKFIIFAILFIIFTIIFCLIMNISNNDDKTISTIKGYDYSLKKRDTDLMEENFNYLKEVLSKDKINNKKYAEYLSKLFIIDLYTLNNKNSKYDVGGEEYIYPEIKEMYKQKVQDTIYNYLTPSKNLPEVSSINLKSITETDYKYNDEYYEGYELSLNWKYVKQNDYDTNAVVTVINIDNKLYVASIMPEVEE